MRQEINFNSGWYFHEGDIPMPEPKYKAAMYNTAKTENALWGPASRGYTGHLRNNIDSWQPVTLPHDYTITQVPSEENNDTLGYFKYNNAWYIKNFTLEEVNAGKHIALLFEGIATHADIYINGSLVMHNFCGYNSFEVDITDYALFGENQNRLAVYVKTDCHESWWYEGAGIYRPVKLTITETVSVDLWGVYAKSCRLFDDTWQTVVETTVRNDSPTDRKIYIRTTLLDSDGEYAAGGETEEMYLSSKDKTLMVETFQVEKPKLWDTDSPEMYKIRTEILDENLQVLDSVITSYAYREIGFDADKGFFLNGRNVKIKGVCCHQDYGITGKAVPPEVQHYRLKLLKEMGANAYRCAHYPHHSATMDALDKLGFLVMAETRHFGSSPEELKQLEMLIKRDRNHPCVIMWSMGNEEPLFTEERGVRIFETMRAAVKRLDDTRPIMAAVSVNPASAKLMEVCDIIGVNYNLPALDALREKFPNKPMVSSENCATGTTRSWYRPTCPERGYINGFDSSPNSNTGFFSREGTWRFISERPWLMGGFQWAGIEHRGETRWPRLCSQSGALDLFLQKKDAFYQNRSYWTDEPMIHLLPHWNHPGREGEEITVWAYTNCEEAELFINGESMGRIKVDRPGHAEWDVVYTPGELKAVGFINGTEAACETVETTGRPVKLALEHMNSEKTGRVAVVNCYALDEKGRKVPDAQPYVRFYAENGARIIGTGSDICDHTPPSCHDRRMRAGVIAAAVELDVNGNFTVYAESESLDTARLTFSEI